MFDGNLRHWNRDVPLQTGRKPFLLGIRQHFKASLNIVGNCYTTPQLRTAEHEPALFLVLDYIDAIGKSHIILFIHAILSMSPTQLHAFCGSPG